MQLSELVQPPKLGGKASAVIEEENFALSVRTLMIDFGEQILSYIKVKTGLTATCGEALDLTYIGTTIEMIYARPLAAQKTLCKARHLRPNVKLL
jgi:hypothetical protein